MSLMEFALIHQYFLKRDCDIFINALDDRAPITKDLTIIAAGLFVRSIINCTGREPKIYGKPSDMIGEYCVQEFQIKDRKRCLFIGDNLHLDIEFAFRQGFQSLLVLSGAHSKEDMLLQPTEYQPNYYADSLGDFVEFFNNLSSNVQKQF